MFALIRRFAELGFSPADAGSRARRGRPFRRRRLFVESLEHRAMLTVPDVLIDGASAFEEGDQIAVTVFLSSPSEDTIAVDYTIGDMVANDVATPTVDYWLIGASPGVFNGTITFAPEATEHTFYIGTVNDTAYEGKEWLRIELSNPVNATLTDEHDEYAADVFIADAEDPFIVVSQNNEAVEPPTELDTSYASFTVELVGGMGENSTQVDWTTIVEATDTATAGADFQSVSGTVTVSSSDPYAEILVPLTHDGTGEVPETFHVKLTGATNGITILQEDGVTTVFETTEPAEEEPPPDCECGAQGARHVIGVTSDKGDEFWEGDEVTFTASLDSPTPTPPESFVWQWRRLRLITRAGEKLYGDWQNLPGAGGGETATHTFSEPFIGQVRVILTSSGTVSSRAIDIRAKAAFPVDFAVTSSGQVGTHLEVHYAWASSSGRMADLDGVTMSEFVWITQKGYNRGQSGKPVQQFLLPAPPFQTLLDDGKFVTLGEQIVIEGEFIDKHGGIKVYKGAEKTQQVKQYYAYALSDGYNYHAETEFGPQSWKILGDPRGEQRIIDNLSVHYAVLHGATPGTWKLVIDKPGHGTIEMPITSFPFLAD